MFSTNTYAHCTACLLALARPVRFCPRIMCAVYAAAADRAPHSHHDTHRTNLLKMKIRLLSRGLYSCKPWVMQTDPYAGLQGGLALLPRRIVTPTVEPLHIEEEAADGRTRLPPRCQTGSRRQPPVARFQN